MVVGPPPIDVTKRNKIRDPLPALRRYVIFEWALSGISFFVDSNMKVSIFLEYRDGNCFSKLYHLFMKLSMIPI